MTRAHRAAGTQVHALGCLTIKSEQAACQRQALQMHVSRTRCSVLHAAPQSRDPHEPDTLGPRLGSAAFHAALRPGHESYRPFSARLSRNTPCSPNMFQNHQGAVSRSGRP
jgi:hypothetical protein